MAASSESPSKTARSGRGVSGGIVAGFAPALAKQHAQLRSMMDSQPDVFRASRSYSRFKAPPYASQGPASSGAATPLRAEQPKASVHRSPPSPLPSPSGSAESGRSYSRSSARSRSRARSHGRSPSPSGSSPGETGLAATASNLSSSPQVAVEGDTPASRLRRAVLLGDAAAAKRAIRDRRAAERVAARAAARAARALARTVSPPPGTPRVFSPKASFGSLASLTAPPRSTGRGSEGGAATPQPPTTMSSHQTRDSPAAPPTQGKPLRKKRSLRLTLPCGDEIDLERGAGGLDAVAPSAAASPAEAPHKHFLRSSRGVRGGRLVRSPSTSEHYCTWPQPKAMGPWCVFCFKPGKTRLPEHPRACCRCRWP